MGELQWTDEDRRRRLALRHGLLTTTASNPRKTSDIVHDLICLHSSDPVTVYLTVAARSQSATVSSIQADLSKLVRHHAMRRTLWVFNAEAAPMAHAACTRKIASAERRKLEKALAGSTVANAPEDPTQWVDSATKAVMGELRDGPLATRSLGERLPEHRVLLQMAPGKSYAATQSALNRVVLQMGFEGLIMRGTTAGDGWTNSQYLWERAEGIEDETISEVDGQRWLAKQWLHRFGPGLETDLQWWAGWTVTATRQALAQVEATQVAFEDGTIGWVLAEEMEPDPPTEDWTAVLPGLDPTVMGWKSRDWYLNPEYTATLFDRNGNGGPTLWVNGRVVGGWVQRSSGSLVYRLVDDSVTPAQQESLERQLAGMEAFIGDTRFKVRFPAPLQKELYAE